MAQLRAISWMNLLLVLTTLAALLQTVTGASGNQCSAARTQRAVDTTTPRIIVPLYIYPLPNAWDKLYTAIRANPAAAFTVIINPNSGPGSGNAPDSDYTEAIKKLRATPAPGQILELVGYVATGYGKTLAKNVKADVTKYSRWPTAVRPDGIFFDETDTASKYLDQYAKYTDFVKSLNWTTTSTTSSKQCNSKSLVQRSGITILNPGTWPQDARFWSTSSDHIIVYEDKLANFDLADYQRKTSNNKQASAFQRSYIFYNVNPNNATTKDGSKFANLDALVNATVNRLSARGGLFVTNLDIASTDVYASFSSIWPDFVRAMANIS
ncbi:uncharacterized protein UMAG_06157 [Mycosarcoma maydis]|uniref:Spherulin 4 n=1 Tax=Mycosarcoma maydis TaxID=5270 RepID=A0A0D1DNZ0_MYCMD|nr:uncharacterized protein UMAG_06157 [Ustilago maydis 521]KIS65776.1 hypothetical protein UMAG_06157 [Ustilago maydis 521]|eukprot:XP_011392536.1 hypothetical protein UMAG_06157 [Ustilago maydis 521]